MFFLYLDGGFRWFQHILNSVNSEISVQVGMEKDGLNHQPLVGVVCIPMFPVCEFCAVC